VLELLAQALTVYFNSAAHLHLDPTYANTLPSNRTPGPRNARWPAPRSRRTSTRIAPWPVPMRRRSSRGRTLRIRKRLAWRCQLRRRWTNRWRRGGRSTTRWQAPA